MMFFSQYNSPKYSELSDKNSYLIIFPNGHVYWNATDYFLEKSIIDSYSTCKNHRLYLVKFFNYLIRVTSLTESSCNEAFENKIYSVTSDDLRQYLNYLQQGKDKISPQSANQNLSAIVAFYWWLQANEKTDVKYLCGWADTEKKLPVHQIKVFKPKPNTSHAYQHHYKQRYNPNYISRYVPSTREISDLYDLAIKHSTESAPKDFEDADVCYRTRDGLIFDWMSQGGLRLNEIKMLRCDTIKEAWINAQAKSVGTKLLRATAIGIPCSSGSIKYMVSTYIKDGVKNSKNRHIDVSPDLIQRTLEYIEFERQLLLDFGDCIDTGEVFVSTVKKRKGSSARMSKTSISKIVTFDLTEEITGSKSIKSAHRLKCTPHALRRYAITRFGVLLLKVEIERGKSIGRPREMDYNFMQNKLKRFAGHNSFDTTLQYYFDLSHGFLAKEQ